MKLKHNKISKGNCFYIIHPVYKNGRNTSQAYEQLGYPKGEHHCGSLKKWIRKYIGDLNGLEQIENRRK